MTGNRWLLAAAVTCMAALPRPAAAQFDATTPGRSGAGTRPGQQNAYQKPPPLRPGQPISVMVFPFGFEGDAPAGGETPTPAATEQPATPGEAPMPGGAAAPTAPESRLTPTQQQIAQYLTAAVKAGFLASPAFNVTTYNRNASLVQAALNQHDTLKNDQVSELIDPATGAVNVDKAKVVAHRLGIQTILVGTVEMKDDPAARTAEVTLNAQLIESTSGEVLRTAVVSGAAQGAEGVALIAVQERAALDAAQKVLPAMGIQLAPITNQESDKPAKGRRTSRATRSSSSSDEGDARRGEREARAAERRKAEEEKRQAAAARREKAAAEKAARRQEKANDDDKAVQKDQQPVQPPATQPGQPAQPATPAVQPPAAPATGAPAVTGAAANVPTTVRGASNAEGLPIPYGYALGDTKRAIPTGKKQGLKVPSWLGVAGFLAGISFLL